ncbi:PAS domain S-box protein [Haloarcula salina]|uniref:PAS domain S-box protein n=1 Tax=Haloarcula salina TaxID=1429914 RepID=UPI003C6F52B7
MGSQIRVLHVDDDPELAEVVATFLEREDDRFTVETVLSADEGLERLAGAEFDCVVSDYDMPKRNGIEFLETVRSTDSDLPFILYTGKGSEEIASDAISSGVTDYLQKGGGIGQYTVLANRIANAAAAYQTRRNLERKSRQDEAIADLSRDALEGLDRQPLFQRAVGIVSDRLGTEYTGLFRLSAADGRFSTAAASGWDEAVLEGALGGGDGETLASYTLSASEPVVVPDRRTDDRFRDSTFLSEHGVVSGISVVVGSRDDPWGVLETHSTTARSFSADDVTFVQNVANLLGSAIQRHRSEQRRRESERLFREIAEVSPDTIFRLDTDGVFTYVSPAVESLLGYAAEELLGENFQRYVPETSLSVAFDGFSRVAAGETVRELEVALIDADGDLVDVEVSASPVMHDGSVRYVQGLVRDITDRKERERDLERYRAYTDRVLDGIDDVLFVIDESGALRRWNESFATVTGYDDALSSMNVFDFVATPERRAEDAIRGLFEADHTRLQAALLTADGREIPYEYVTNRVSHPDGTPLIVGIGREITGQNERERELRELKAQYETLIENIPGIGVFLFDRDARYTVAGGDELSAVGLTSTDFEGASPSDLFPEAIADELEQYYRAALAGDENTFEQAFQDRYYRIQTVPVRDESGDVISGLAVSVDVTEGRARQTELERQNEQLKEFASVVSHDLRNPLNVARGQLELARAECDSDHLTHADTALDRSHALIDDLLTLARSGEHVRATEEVALAATVERCWQNVPTEAATLDCRTEQTILADPGRLEQLLENLIRNAVEHGGGEVTVTVGPLDDGFYVEDTGVGLPVEDRERIFEAGYSTDDDGSGFGLRIVKQITDAHGWEISVADGERGGARFEIRGVETA